MATPYGLANAFGIAASLPARAFPSSASLSDTVFGFRTAPTSAAPENTLM